MKATPSPRTCWRCRKSDSSAQRFILTCHTCSRSWHHRCHAPVVTDQQVIAFLRDGAQWCCRRCTNAASTLAPPPDPTPPLIDLTLLSDDAIIDLTTLSDEHEPPSHQRPQPSLPLKTEMLIPTVRQSIPALVDPDWCNALRMRTHGSTLKGVGHQLNTTNVDFYCSVRDLLEAARDVRL